MADEKSKRGRGASQRSKFPFLVDFGGGRKAQFREVSGFDAAAQPTGSRRGHTEDFSKIAMPGLVKNTNITLKRGKFEGSSDLQEWLDDITANTSKRRTVVISLLDASGAAQRVWTLRNARPMKFTGPALNAKGNDVAIESIEVAHDGLRIAKS